MSKILLLTFLLTLTNAKEDAGFKYMVKVYEDCQRTEGFLPCLKKKAILFFDRAARMDSIPVIEGVDVVKDPNTSIVPISENEIEAVLPRSLQDKDETLTHMLWDKIATFANSRTIQLSLPKMTGEELNRGIEEGRGKMKKMMSMMMMGAGMKMAAMLPMGMAGLFILVLKALITSKIALLLAGIMVLKKLMSSKGGGGGGGGHDSHGWSSGGGGYDRRAYNDVSDMAYSAYKKD